jgi:hypothetical protein
MNSSLWTRLKAFWTAHSTFGPVVSAKIEWIHPDLPRGRGDVIDEAGKAQRLFDLFEGLSGAQKGTAWDTPFYDTIVTFTDDRDRQLSTKVYLPRLGVFPGMWKHPSGVLMYFEQEKGQPAKLLELLESYLPVAAIYPRDTPNPLPDVPFERGIPNFRAALLPISSE